MLVFISLIIVVLFIAPKTRPFMIGLVVAMGFDLLIGLILPEFFLEEIEFWLGLLIVIVCVGMLISYLHDWEKEDREDRYRFL